MGVSVDDTDLIERTTYTKFLHIFFWLTPHHIAYFIDIFFRSFSKDNVFDFQRLKNVSSVYKISWKKVSAIDMSNRLVLLCHLFAFAMCPTYIYVLYAIFINNHDMLRFRFHADLEDSNCFFFSSVLMLHVPTTFCNFDNEWMMNDSKRINVDTQYRSFTMFF